MQQRIQASGLLSQNAIEQQKQFVQSQIGLQEVSSSKALDSSAQTGHVGVIDWQEEIYQKIKSMKELYFADLTELYQKIVLKLQQLQHDVLMPSVKTSEQFDKMKNYKIMLERTLHLLQLPRSNIQLGLKDKLPLYEKQITSFLATNKKKVVPSQPPGQQQFQHPGGHPQSISQQQSSQVPQVQQHDNYANQQMNLQGSTTSVQPAAMPSMQHGSVPLSTHFGVPTPQQNITNALQTGSAIDSVQGSSFSSLQQGGIASMQQGGLSANSPFDPSPSTPIAPSPIPGDEKQLSGITSVPNAGRAGHQPTAVAPQAQSLAVTTPGISASPLLAEFTSPDGNQTNHTNSGVAKAITTERPFERLIKVVNHALLEEIREINQRLIGTVVNICEEDTDSNSVAPQGEGTIVKCVFTTVALCPSLKSQFASEHVSPILPLRLLVPANYPKCSPVLLDKFPDEQRESDDLSVKARSTFIISLRGLSQPMSLGEMARTWDVSARKVITEYAQQTGGGTFSSRYGAWENCVGA
ncbi:hypothetical protein C4D60_Mb08t09140 [Musa balbisiana]|uniref:ARC105/Med15 mediator subunit C-terminal domain-containing protein n=1 Tax=Musa balbisiana TaxID=52838 RepID=A0A4S8K2F5_MUSBA|nr:hypothetical protein C4D60_Mb08t09140 [Musa balbisiana]